MRSFHRRWLLQAFLSFAPGGEFSVYFMYMFARLFVFLRTDHDLLRIQLLLVIGGGGGGVVVSYTKFIICIMVTLLYYFERSLGGVD